MIEKILERLEEKKAEFASVRVDYAEGLHDGYMKAIKIVQEVAKEYGNGWTLCNDRLPEEHKLVLIYAESTARGGSIRRVAQLHNGFWFVQTASDTLGLIGQYNVIKWAEVPEV